MSFAIEPKFVFPEGAVGIENTFVMEAGGIRPLTRAPEEIIYVR
jgi:Xaa-Pro aminopeptidase